MKKQIYVNVDGENYISLGSKRKKMCYGCAAHGNQDLCRMLNSKLQNGSNCISLEIIFINDVRKIEVEALQARIAELEANAARNLQDSGMVRDMKIESCGDDNFDVYMTRGHANPNEFLSAVAEYCKVELDDVYGRQVVHTFWIERSGKYESARKDQDGAFPVTFIGLY